VLEQARVAELEASVTGWTATPEESGELARIYADRGRWARAIELQRYAGDSPETLETLAYMLFRADRFREAQELYAELSAAGGRADLVINDGVSFARLGDDVAAVAAYRQALALDPTSWKAQLYLGNALLRLGQREEAIEAYRQFLGVGEDGESAERIRRILKQIAPQALPDFEPALSGAGDEGS
jgi:tetratricopeptide (TPR) repeat protein